MFDFAGKVLLAVENENSRDWNPHDFVGFDFVAIKTSAFGYLDTI